MRRSIRGLLSSVLLVALAGVSPISFTRPVLAEAPPVMTASAEQLKTDAVAALRKGEFDRTSQLLKQAAANTSDPTLELMASWVSTFSSQYDKTLADRKAEYDKAVAQVKLLQENSKPDYALDALTRAYTFATNKETFPKESWVDSLIKERAAAADAAEKSGNWEKAVRTYLDLSAIEPANPLWKGKLKTSARYVQIQALYTPDYFKSLQKSRRTEDDQVEALLKTANLLSSDDPASRAATQPIGDELADAKVDWHEVLRGIDYDMVPGAIRDAVKNWYRDVNYAQLAEGGIEGLRILATTPQIGTAFPTLADDAKRQQFIQALDKEMDQIKATPPDYGDIKALVTRVRDANMNTVGLPESVIVHEFMDGALSGLDQFSSMIWPQQVEEFRSSTEGEFSGVGIQIERDPKTGYLKVVSPIEDSPAYKALIRAGSFITQINGEPVKKMMLDQAVKKIKGPTGSRVTLTVLSADGSSKDISLRRDTVKVASIKGWKRAPSGGWDWMVDPVQRVGYIRLSSFTKTSSDELEDALKQLQQQGARGVILDLRSDPGGLLPAAVDVADKFIPSGTIVSTRADRDTPQSPSISSADPDGKKIKIPLIVLVNQFSASASEIVSGALKDQHRAIIVGERTYGKGSVQMLFPVSSRNAVLKLTTHHYYLPSGRCLHREETSTEWGVDPDYAIQITPDQVKAIMDARQEMDVLHYSSENQARPAQPTTAPATQMASAPKKPADLLEVDPQLSAAVMLMRLEVAGVKL